MLAHDAKLIVTVCVSVLLANFKMFIVKYRYLACNGMVVKLDSQLYTHAKFMEVGQRKCSTASISFYDE